MLHVQAHGVGFAFQLAGEQFQTAGDQLTISYRLQMARYRFRSTEYAALRQLFDLLISRSNQPIVLKKQNTER